MKIKKIFITILVLLKGQFLFSQCISIELSLIWEKSYEIMEKDIEIIIPQLNITYRNNCNNDFFFLKVSEGGDIFPKIPCLVLDNTFYEEYTKPDYVKKLYGKYSNQTFELRIYGALTFSSSWLIYCDRNLGDTFMCSLLNCYLNRIYEFIRLNENIELFRRLNKEGYNKTRFEPEDLHPDSLFNSFSDRFVFLKSGEIHTDTYNLIAFQILEGCYTFSIGHNEINNYVLSNQIDPVTRKFFDKELELPEIVGEYYRYTGAFNTNKVTVCFGERQE